MDHSAPEQALLAFVPQNERSRMLHDLLQSLPLDDQSSVNFVASLVVQHSDDANYRQLLALLDQAIRTDQGDCAVAVGLRFPKVGEDLLAIALNAVQNAKSANGASYLSFAKLTIPHLPIGSTHTLILPVCLDLLTATDQHLAIASRDLIFALLSMGHEGSQTEIVLPSLARIWTCITTLLSSSEKQQTLIGWSLWLRLVLTLPEQRFDDLISEEYWRLILHGLRRGDVERRKLCLNILRVTTATDSTAVLGTLPAHFDRYCTVFETIVLGRYINQVQECEKDLDSFASNTALQPRWLYILLASALDGQMQDSSRKFIGNWLMTMRSKFTPTTELFDFLRDDFLPWAIQGSLYVASLRQHNGQLRCLHGDRLSHFIKRLLEQCEQPDRLVEIVVDTIMRKRHSLFAYATVYLLEGLGNRLREDQRERLSDLSGMPEVARDYVTLRTRRAIGKLTMSRNEILEQRAIEKCGSTSPDADSIQDLWSDLDYLEYPKRLLMKFPQALLHTRLIQQAMEDPQLADDIWNKLHKLRKMSETKASLFPPLVVAIRNVIFTAPAAIKLLRLDTFIIDICERPPRPTIDFMLEEATSYLVPFPYEHYFGKSLSYGFAAFIDLVNRLGEHPDIVENMLLHLLQRWRNQRIPTPTVSVWKNLLQLEVMLLCMEQYSPTSSQIPGLLEDLFHILAIEPLPQYRYLLEWMIVRLITRFELQATLLKRLGTKDHHSNPKHLASLMKIGVILARDDRSGEEFTLRLATTFVPMAASSKIVIRHEAQWQMPLLMDHARAKEWSSITRNPALTALDEYIRSLERFHDPPRERQAGRFDAEKDHTLTNLVEGCWLDVDATESPLARRDDFMQVNEAGIQVPLPRACMPLGSAIERADLVTAEENHVVTRVRTVEDVSALQTKGTAYLARAPSNLSSPTSRARNVIVLGSLVDNPYNLGGLSRVSEIFGASALCLQNHNVLSNKDFTSVSVSSHLHLPIVQLSALGVPEFLAERKVEGYAVVGIEQTDRSVILGSQGADLPEKVVLVVGSEKEGIPAVILTLCDVLVEIPQQGITRSLNVQTAAGIVLYEHGRQHRR